MDLVYCTTCTVHGHVGWTSTLYGPDGELFFYEEAPAVFPGRGGLNPGVVHGVRNMENAAHALGTVSTKHFELTQQG